MPADPIEILSLKLYQACCSIQTKPHDIARLVAQGARANWSNHLHNGNTPLIGMVEHYNEKSLIQTIFSQAPIGTLSQQNTERFQKNLETLLQLGADIDTANWRGETPLHIAAAGSAVSIIEVLLQKKPNLLFKNDKGLNAYMLAFGQTPPHLSALLCLLKYQAPTDRETIVYLKERLQTQLDIGGVELFAQDSCAQIIQACYEKMSLATTVADTNNTNPISQSAKNVDIKRSAIQKI